MVCIDGSGGDRNDLPFWHLHSGWHGLSSGAPCLEATRKWPHTGEPQLTEPSCPLDARGIIRAIAIQDHIAVPRQLNLPRHEFVESQWNGAWYPRHFLAGTKRTKVDDHRAVAGR